MAHFYGFVVIRIEGSVQGDLKCVIEITPTPLLFLYAGRTLNEANERSAEVKTTSSSFGDSDGGGCGGGD